MSERATPRQRARRTGKRTFNIRLALDRIRTAVAPFPKAALFDLAAQGHTSTFEQVVACIICIRTRDEVAVPTALNLFATACTARQVSKLRPIQIDRLIHNRSFHEGKAKPIHAIARRVVDEFDAGDYVLWRSNNGTNNSLPNDNGLGTPVGQAHYELWRANFGNVAGTGSGLGSANRAVPEPAAMLLILLGVQLACVGRQRS